MAAITEMNNGRTFLQLFGQKEEEGETAEQFAERKIEHAKKKLRIPEVNKYFQIKVGRNESCPCGSEKKFKKCCWNKINQPEFQITPPLRRKGSGGLTIKDVPSPQEADMI